MTVEELRKLLEQYPGDLRIDVMFPQGNDAYWVTGTELLEIANGQKVVIVEIDNMVPLRAV